MLFIIGLIAGIFLIPYFLVVIIFLANGAFKYEAFGWPIIMLYGWLADKE